MGSEEYVARIRIKERNGPSGLAWIMALWSPTFTHFLVDWLNDRPPGDCEPQLGEVFNDAIAAGLRIRATIFPMGEFIDIGTPDDLARLQRHGLGPSVDKLIAD
jgi:glucose-1-phosphate thymidylyltransferase